MMIIRIPRKNSANIDSNYIAIISCKSTFPGCTASSAVCSSGSKHKKSGFSEHAAATWSLVHSLPAASCMVFSLEKISAAIASVVMPAPAPSGMDIGVHGFPNGDGVLQALSLSRMLTMSRSMSSLSGAGRWLRCLAAGSAWLSCDMSRSAASSPRRDRLAAIRSRGLASSGEFPRDVGVSLSWLCCSLVL